MSDKVTITKEEYFNLKLDAERLNRLEIGGVDNWSHYGDAIHNVKHIGLPTWDDFEEDLRIEIFGKSKEDA